MLRRQPHKADHGDSAQLQALLRAFVRSPAYNKCFAGGHQATGIIPLPVQSPDKQPRSFLAAHGYVDAAFKLSSDEYAVVALNPYTSYPVCYCITDKNSRFQWPVAATRYADHNSSGGNQMQWENTSPLTNGTLPAPPGSVLSPIPTRAFDLPWVGMRDPRELVSGVRGNLWNDTTITAPGELTLQQFMGGNVNVSVTSAWGGAGRFAIIDSKSYPALYGTKVSPITTVGYENGETTATLTPINVPDAEDTFQWFPPSQTSSFNFFNYSIHDLMGLVQNKTVTGSTDDATMHAHYNLPPEGTRWAPWSGAFNINTGGYNNATLGGVPARNMCAFLAAGYPLVIVSNDQEIAEGVGVSQMTSPITVRIRAYLAYNVHVPTTGDRANPVLAEIAPVTPPHAASTSSIRSIPTIHTDVHEASRQTHEGSVNASQKSGLNAAHVYLKPPTEITPKVASKATSALEPLPHIDPKEVVGSGTDADPLKILHALSLIHI